MRNRVVIGGQEKYQYHFFFVLLYQHRRTRSFSCLVHLQGLIPTFASEWEKQLWDEEKFEKQGHRSLGGRFGGGDSAKERPFLIQELPDPNFRL